MFVFRANNCLIKIIMNYIVNLLKQNKIYPHLLFSKRKHIILQYQLFTIVYPELCLNWKYYVICLNIFKTDNTGLNIFASPSILSSSALQCNHLFVLRSSSQLSLICQSSDPALFIFWFLLRFAAFRLVSSSFDLDLYGAWKRTQKTTPCPSPH